MSVSAKYRDTLQYLYSRLPMFQRVGAVAYKKDLGNTLALCAHVDNPHRRFPSIHVGGTNGKGSVSHMLAAACQASGLKVGLYTSPHYKDFRERIKINGRYIPRASVVAFVDNNKSAIEAIQPSFFELTVAMAFDYFAREKVDIAVIEVGLGGRLDSTNVISPLLSVITNISYDHMDLLGDTLDKIAFEKAGIIKAGIPVVIGETHPESAPVFLKKAKEVGAEIVFADQRYGVREASPPGPLSRGEGEQHPVEINAKQNSHPQTVNQQLSGSESPLSAGEGEQHPVEINAKQNSHPQNINQQLSGSESPLSAGEGEQHPVEINAKPNSHPQTVNQQLSGSKSPLSAGEGEQHPVEINAKPNSHPQTVNQQLSGGESPLSAGEGVGGEAFTYDVTRDQKAAGSLQLQAGGPYQTHNLATVLQAWEALGEQQGFLAIFQNKKIPAGREARQQWLQAGLAHLRELTRFMGRWQIIGREPTVLCDSAHNEAGLRAAFGQIGQMDFKRLHIVCGFVADKDLNKALALFPMQATYYFAKANIPRGLDAAALRTAAAERNLHGKSYRSVKNALAAAKRAAAKDDLIVVIGSIFVVAEVL
jgi:folylpolyglutamate synthase/dihydropteroate synthase